MLTGISACLVFLRHGIDTSGERNAPNSFNRNDVPSPFHVFALQNLHWSLLLPVVCLCVDVGVAFVLFRFLSVCSLVWFGFFGLFEFIGGGGGGGLFCFRFVFVFLYLAICLCIKFTMFQTTWTTSNPSRALTILE